MISRSNEKINPEIPFIVQGWSIAVGSRSTGLVDLPMSGNSKKQKAGSGIDIVHHGEKFGIDLQSLLRYGIWKIWSWRLVLDSKSSTQGWCKELVAGEVCRLLKIMSFDVTCLGMLLPTYGIDGGNPASLHHYPAVSFVSTSEFTTSQSCNMDMLYSKVSPYNNSFNILHSWRSVILK